MALIALTSASGAPGVTTTALGLSLVWPRPVLLIEADPSHGSSILPGYLRGAIAPRGASRLGLVKAQRVGELEHAIGEHTVALDDDGRRRFIPAVPSPEQAPGLNALWSPLAEALTALDADGIDVIVDAGRLGAAHAPDALLQAADAAVLVTRTQLPAVAAAHARVTHLTGLTPVSGHSAGLLLIGEGRPYTGSEITEVTDLPVTASIAWDESAASALSLGATRPRRWEQSRYVRSLISTADALAARTREEPVPTAAGTPTTPGRWDRG